MTLTENLRIGMDALLAQKARSLLTMLGIIFGVAAVIAMTSISSGARKEMMEAIKGLGVNNVMVMVREPASDAQRKALRKLNPKALHMGDVHALRELLSDIRHAVPLRRIEETVRMPVVMEVGLTGVIPEFSEVFGIQLTAGRFLAEEDNQQRAPVAVITEPLSRKLFPLTTPINQQIKVGEEWFTVVGVVRTPFGGFSAMGLDMPDMSRDIYLPLQTLQSRFPLEKGASPLASVLLQVNEEQHVRPVAAAVNRILERRHRGAEDVEIVVPIELLKQSQQTQRIFNIVMGAIASISLLVGGIGIMNIMLSSVLERTREIGVRRAVGATRTNVVVQFLLEAVLLSLIGGAVGILLGMGMSWAITLYAGWRTVIGIWAVLLAFGVSASVGILFGWWPAQKAAAMNVINALRYE